MLPEALSNGWCSLRPGEDRGCLFVEMRIDAARPQDRPPFRPRPDAQRRPPDLRAGAGGARRRQTISRLPLAALYAAFRALLAAREARGTLDLDLPERRVVLDDDGPGGVASRRGPRLDSHRLIEEFMVLANVAAAEELERLRQPCVYRVHAPPSEEKLRGAARLPAHASTLSLPPGNQLHPRDLDRVLKQGRRHASRRRWSTR